MLVSALEVRADASETEEEHDSLIEVARVVANARDDIKGAAARALNNKEQR